MEKKYRDPAFTEAMNKYFDINHTETRRVLLSINEDDQNMVLTTLTGKLYDNIIDKVDDIDFGDIPGTKGDFQKLPSYDKIVECVNIIRDILEEMKEDTEPTDVIHNAIRGLINNRDVFEEAYRLNVELPIMTYETIGLSIITSLSLLISSCIDFIKDPGANSFTISLERTGKVKSSNHLLFENLRKFNKLHMNSDNLRKSMQYVIDMNKKNLIGTSTGAVVVGSIALVGILLNIVPIIRELIFFFYFSRTKLSDYFEVQANLLTMNTYNIQNSSTLNAAEKKKISEKQNKIAKVFSNIANKLAIDAKTAEKAADKEVTKSDKKYKTNEILDSMPDSAASSDSLF